MVLGCMVVWCMGMIGCALTKVVVEPPVDTASPLPIVGQTPRPPLGPPPGHVEPQNYIVREKLILGEVTTVIDRGKSPDEPALAISATQKTVVNKGKKHKKTGKPVS
jgi:hypothetical protein